MVCTMKRGLLCHVFLVIHSLHFSHVIIFYHFILVYFTYSLIITFLYVGKVQSFANQDFESLKRQCRNGRLFEDPVFPASNRLLVDDNSNYVVSYFGRTRFDAGSIEWLRPKVI